MLLRTFGTIALAVVATQAPTPAVRNGGFEDANGGPVPGWSVPAASAAAGYSARLSDEQPKSGARAAVLVRDLEGKAPGFGNLMQTIDAAPFRDRRVTLRAFVRTAAGSRAQLWLRVDRPGGMGFLDNMADRPIVSPAWTEYRIQADVQADATYLAFGLMLPGEGKAWLDEVSIESVALTRRPPAPPRAFAGRGLENVIAFAKLLGYVRYFHPSDQAARADWEALAIEGVSAVESAASPAALARLLEERFRPLAPTLRVFAGPKAPAPPPELKRPAEARRLVTWKHRGVGIRPGPVYASERVTDDAPEARVQVVDLGGGVKAALPLAVWSDGERTLPPVDAQSSPAISTSAADRETRLAAVALAWNVFQHFYPYFDVVPADWPASLRSALASAAQDDQAAFAATLQRLVAELHDGHGRVSAGARSGLSFLPLAWEWIEGQLVVIEVATGESAVQRGDVVKAIDGAPAAEKVAAAERLISGATPQWKRYRALLDLRMGPEGEVTLSVATGDGAARDVRLRRRTGPPVDEQRPEKIAEIKPGIVYVDPSRLSDQEFNAALPQLVHARGVVFEMRGYPRIGPMFIQRLIQSPVQSAQWLVPVVTRPDRESVTWDASGRWTLVPLAPRISAPVAFVTDGRAISYAETCMGIVEHYKLGEIVGAPTAGTNGNINPFMLPGGYTITWTGMKVLKHDGSRHHGVGILPTIPVRRTIEGVRAGRDEMLERAIEAVQRGGIVRQPGR